MTAGVKLLRKNNAPLWKGCFQTTVVLTVEQTASDYFPALFSRRPKEGIILQIVCQKKNHTPGGYQWIIKIKI